MADQGWWHGAVIYQIYPRSFYDSNGDGIGDLRGIVDHLEHVASLGVDAIWMSPFYPSPMVDFGYDITAHCKVHPDYGTMDDFQDLVDKAHDLGLKVIIDAVLNHTSAEHPWFIQSRQSRDNPKADWYQWADPKPDGSPPNNWIGRFAESQWTWCPVREQYYRHQYMADQPALNLSNPEVVEARLGFMRKWLDRGVDGLRFDAVTQYYADPDLRDNPPGDPSDGSITPVDGFSTFAYQLHEHDCNDERIEGFLERLIDQVECAGCTFTFAELDIRYKAYESLGRFTGEGLLNGAYTPDPMGLKLAPSSLAAIVHKIDDYAEMRHHVWTLTNHDASRIVSRWGPRITTEEKCAAISKLASALLTMLGGQVSLFQGEELGIPDADYSYEEIKDPQGKRFWPKGRGRDPIRHPLPWTGEKNGGFTTGEPWLPVKDDIVACNIARQDADEDSVLNHWRRMIALRREHDVLRYGAMEIAKAEDETGILAIRRTHEGKTCEGWFNTNETPADLPEPEGKILARSSAPLGTPYSWILFEA